MIDFKNNDLIITDEYNKKKILKHFSDNKILVNVKFNTLEQFKNKYFGTYNEKTIYYLMKKYNYKYEIAKMYLDNYIHIESLKKELLENDLIIKENINFSRIVVIGYNKIDKYITQEIEKFEYIYDEKYYNNYIHPVYEYNNAEEEIDSVLYKINELLKTVHINKIFLVNVGDDYKLLLKRMFDFYDIPININSGKKIYGTEIVQKFLKNLKENKMIELEENEISNIIIDIINKYSFTEIDDTIISCIEGELKNATLKEDKLENAVNIVSIDDICDDNYYFILNFNQGILPKIYKDEDYLSDEDKIKKGILTSLEKNILEKEFVINKIRNCENILLTYVKRNDTGILYPSSIIDDLNYEVFKNEIRNYNSDIYNKIKLAKKIDNLIKYNTKDRELCKLYSNYQDIDYLTYDNRFTGINKNSLYSYLNNKLSLSYSSIDNYNKCAFRYYINNVLKLDLFEETFMKFIGDLFHYILSICNNDSFDFDLEYDKYIADKKFSNMEKHFINKLKKDLLLTIEIIKKHDSYSELDKALYEERIFVQKDSNIKVTFTGVIDKIKYKEDLDNTYVAIIDYKTGNPKISLNNVEYGIDMQLPIYLYLVRNSKIKNPVFVGFYLQKIIHNLIPYNHDKNYKEDLNKRYNLEGYSNSNEDYLKMFDKTYEDSLMIKGMKLSSKGFYNYTKVLSNDDIEELIELVDKKINEARDNILEAKFDINPKKIGNDLVGCNYCSYQDICFKKESDAIKLKENKFESRCDNA